MIFTNVCCNNRCHGNAVKAFWALCLLSICWLVGDHLLFRDFGPYSIIQGGHKVRKHRYIIFLQIEDVLDERRSYYVYSPMFPDFMAILYL
jgi:hypothetical protein